jgi:enoyl-CoA hydratase/carnithine racemase
MAYQNLSLTKEESIGTISLNRPPANAQLNADQALAAGLVHRA